MKPLLRKGILITWIMILVVSLAGTVTAEESAPKKDWEFSLEFYLWGASIGGKSAAGSDIDVAFDDILDNLEFAFMGLGAVRKGKWSLSTDVIYLDMEDSATVGPGLNASVGLSGWVVTPFVSYSLVETENLDLDILGGARYLSLEADLRVGSTRAEDSGNTWDGVIGVRGDVKLTEKWFIPFHFDIGTGKSDVTWQAFGGIAYRFKYADLALAYRYLRWDFDDNKAVDDLYFHGPYIGVRFRF